MPTPDKRTLLNSWPPNPPSPRTRQLAERIRHLYGHGGANFPGARELYRAADLIEGWAEIHA